MRVDEVNILNEMAKSKKDGVYSFRGNLWAVKNGNFVAFVDSRGQVFQRCASFNYQIGNFWNIERYDWKKNFIEWLKKELNF